MRNKRKNKWSLVTSVLLGVVIVSCGTQSGGGDISPKGHAKYVNPYIGTAAHGHVFMGAATPFGMVMAGPDNGTGGWDWVSGYNYKDDFITGFSQLHLSGTGIGDLCDISIMPVSKDMDLSVNYKNDPQKAPWLSKFSHEDEVTFPGYYSVKLKTPQKKVEVTTTPRTSMYRISSLDDGKQKLTLDLGFAINWDAPVKTNLKKVDDKTFVGYRFSKGWSPDQRVFFVIKFSQPVSDLKLFDFEAGKEVSGEELTSQQVRSQFSFASNDPLLVSIGISSVSIDNAIMNLNKENPTMDFHKVLAENQKLWEKQLAKIDIQTTDKSVKEIYYTAMYHTMLAPALLSDVNGEFRGPDTKVTKQDFKYYTTLSLWDVFRAAMPFYLLMEPELVENLQKTYMEHFRLSGALPVWTLWGMENWCMTGNHAIPTLTESWLQGYHFVDGKEMLKAMMLSMNNGKRELDLYRAYGYVPYDKGNEGVTITLEYAYNDYCIAKLAEALGEKKIAKQYYGYAKNYKNLFDNKTGFMRGKNSNGRTFREPFDPSYSVHREGADYTEGNAWQHSWFAPHDVAGLIELHGGDEKFVEKLDATFKASSEIKGDNVSPDISGMLGQYAHGNEPSHHIAYMFNDANASWITQEVVRTILDSLYTDQPDGICGNEDCGQMSAWYVWSALGIYPMDPVSLQYEIGSPIVDGATLNFPSGKKFEIVVNDNSKNNIYVNKIVLNGKVLNRSYITHSELKEGGKLEFWMSNQPNKLLFSK